MSVIIRLQNLPWSANALDVRNFFKGLSIPDGGVHIVGGEMGDAFIAFSTDEDARQAMMLNGGKIKEVQVSLLLSSRAEMQKVIEDARRTTMSFMQLSAQGAQQMQQQVPVVPKVTTPAVTVAHQPQPPVISLSGFLAQNLNQQKAQSIYSEIPGLGFLATGGGMFQPNAPAAGLFSALSAQTYSNAGAASNAAFTQLSEQLKKVGEAEKTMGSTAKVPISSSSTTTSTSKKDSGERSSRRSRSSSRERDRRRSRSRSRDRGSRRRGRDRSRDRRSRSRSRERRDRRRRSRSRDRRDDRPREKSRERDQKAADKLSKQRVSRFSDRAEAKAAAVAEVVVVPTPSPTPTPPQPTTFVSPWDTPIQQNLMKLANVGLDKPMQQNAAPTTMGSAPNLTAGDGFGGRNEHQQNNVLPNPIAASYRMNVLPSVNYGSFQSSKPLSNEQLSKLQQLQVRRDPMVYQESNPVGNRQGGHFSDGESKAHARNNQGGYDSLSRRDGGGKRPTDGYQTDGGMNKRNQSMEEKVDRSMYDDIEGQSVKMSHLETITGYGEVRRFFHGQTISSNGIKMINDQNGRRTGVALVRFLRKDGKRYALSRDGMRLKNSVVKIESIADQEFDDAVDSYRPGFDDAQSNWKEVSLDRKDSKKEEVIEIRDDSYKQDNKSGTVVIWNLPTMTTELDLMKIFSDFSVVEVLIIKNYKNPKQLDGYVKFHRWEDARRACDSVHKHYVRNKRVFVKQCTEIEYDAAKNEYEAPQESEPVTVVLDDSAQEAVLSSKASKKNEAVDDDKMDLAEDEDEVGQLNIQLHEPPLLNQMKVNTPPPSNFQLGMRGGLNNESQQRQLNDGPPFSRESPSSYKLGGDSWEREQPQQTPPMNRDPRNMFSQNFSQQQQQQQQQQQKHASQLNLGFGGDINRDPRRRQDAMGQKMAGFDQSNFQGDSSRDSFGSQSRFNSQGPPSQSMDNNLYGQQMGPMGGSNRYDQQQSGSFGNNRYDQQMGNSLVGPMGNNRYEQQMGNSQGNNRYDQQMDNRQGGPLGNNRYQQQQQSQMSNNPGSQFGSNRFDQQMDRNNAGGNDKTTFIMITNLEYNLQESRIQEFFEHAGFNPKHIHIIRNPYGRSSGECLVEFGSPLEAGDTLSKNTCIIGKRKAFIKHLNRNQILDMMQRINQNGPGQNSQRGGQFGGNNSIGGNGSFGGDNNFDGNSSNLGRGNNFGNNDNGNKNIYGGNNYDDNDDNRKSQGNDNRFSTKTRNFGGDYYQGSSYQDDSDNQQLDEEKREDDEPHDEYDEHDDHKDHIDHSDHDDHDEHEDQQKISEKINVPNPETNTDQHIEDLTGNDDLMDEAEAKEPIGEGVFQQGPEDDDPPVKQPIMDDTDSCEIIEVPDQPDEAHEQQSKEQQQQEQLHQQEDVHIPEDEGPDLNDMHQDQHPEPMRGNIVCLNNLPFRARNEELVNYFREYNITLEDVKRRYLPDGRPTGDAMVRFQSGVNAQRAMQTHQNRRIGGRPVRMKILDD